MPTPSKPLVGNADNSSIWGDSLAVRNLRELVANVARSDATALVLGESGTGKELIARALHEQSQRRAGPFVPINMAALPRELAESILFGHEKGAFTGADQPRIGCWEAADGGTLFLDEIGDMDLELQAKLLRCLQDRKIQRIGSAQSRAVQVRVVAATNRDLRKRVRQGQFREDLFYRLYVIPIEVPPLRDHRDDIPLLAAGFLAQAAERQRKHILGFTSEALAALTAYDWPGNVRQLEHLVECLAVLGRNNQIGWEDLPPEIRGYSSGLPQSVAEGNANSAVEKVLPFEQIEKRAILDALHKTRGKVRHAAQLLGMGQATVYRRIKRYGVRLADGFSPIIESA